MKLFNTYHNPFLILGDITHIITILGLLGYIWKKKSTTGLSGKTQILYTLLFVARYVDLFTEPVPSVYALVFKVTYILATFATACTIYFKFKNEDRPFTDTFRALTLVIGAAIIAIFIHYQLTFTEILWSFSEYLEAVVIIPQLHMISNAGKSEKYVNIYIYGLFQYRAFYMMNWMHRYFFENHLDKLSVVPGTIQTLIYLDYFFSIVKNIRTGYYKKCNTEDPNMPNPVYVISANDLLTNKKVNSIIKV